MIWWLSVTVALSVAAGTYLTLSRDVFRCVIGLAVLGAAINLVLFASGRLVSPQPAVIPLGDLSLSASANPLPQALVLTAIVIGFALICFALALALRLIQLGSTDDVTRVRHAEPLEEDPVKPPLGDASFQPSLPDDPAPNGEGRA